MFRRLWAQQHNKIVFPNIACACLGAASFSLIISTPAKTDSEAALNTASDSATSSIRFFSPTPLLYYFSPNEDLEICFDTRTRTPVYVLERLSTKIETVPKSKRRRRPHFVEETRLPEIYRSRNSHYHGSGYDRGHMAPAADFSAENNLQDTFVLTNTCPQVPALNRKLWSRLEHWVRQVAARHETTIVVTGPLWLPDRAISTADENPKEPTLWEYRYPAIGRVPSLISVPTHFFKLVAVVDGNSIVKYAAFVVPNNDSSDRQQLESHLVRWSDLEAVVGMQFFPSLVPRNDETTNWKRLTDQATELVWNEQTRYQEQKPVLLLPTSSSSSSKSKRKQGKQKLSKEVTVPKHLCWSGACQ